MSNSKVYICIEGLNDKVAVSVFSACGAYSINKSLIERHLNSKILCNGSSGTGIYFIGACKEQMLVIIAEADGYLLPKSFLLGINRILLRIGWIILQPSAVIVDIYDYVHIVINA